VISQRAHAPAFLGRAMATAHEPAREPALAATLAEEDLEAIFEEEQDAGLLRRRPWPVNPRVLALGVLALVVLGSVALLFGTRAVAVAGTAGRVGQGVGLSAEDAPSEYCAEFLNKHGFGDLTIQVYDFSLGVAKKIKKDIQGSAGTVAAAHLKDPTVNLFEVGACSGENAGVAWFYPDKSADKDGAFLLADSECRRMNSALQGMKVDDMCLGIYRTPTVQAINAVLEERWADSHIVHMVIGGHGSDDTVNEGTLSLSKIGGVERNIRAELFEEEGSEESQLAALIHRKMAKTGTLFLDSCFGGINGMAQAMSEKLPTRWIFGGTVSLTSEIHTLPTRFDGSSAGPVRVVSEAVGTTDIVMNPETKKKAEGVELKGDEVTEIDEFTGERLIAWYGGKNQGSVNQWRFLSKNKMVIRKGQEVEVAKKIHAARAIYSGDMSVFNVGVPAGYRGTVERVHGDNVPTKGDAVIIFRLPEKWDNYQTGGGGGTTGPLLVDVKEFAKLVVKDSATE